MREPPQFRERVIRLITLQAYAGRRADQRPSDDDLATYEADIPGWDLPPGVEALGRLLNGLPEGKRGPVLTTNFDPLIEIAVRKSGSSATTYVQVDDSSFMTNLQVTSVPSIVHLHGYWRTASTLHTPDQLMRERPALTSALRAILTTHTLLVVGYGGWTDVITEQILQVLQERNSSSLDILWALFESGDEAEEAFALSPLLTTMRAAAPGNVTFYEGIDANELFPQLEARVASILEYDDSPTSKTIARSLIGWTSITPSFIDRIRGKAVAADALSFFDGRIPNWTDAASPYIPPRSLTLEMENRLSSLIASGQSSFSLLVGPSGEGKSMLLKQVGVRLAEQRGDLRILSLESDDFGSVDSVLALDEGQGCLLLIDDAADHLSSLERLVQSIRTEGKHRIHILAATGDSDWRSRGGHLFAWNRHIRAGEFIVSGVSRADALSIVSGWERLGPPALGVLAQVGTKDARVDELVRVAADRYGPSEGTLLGALLVTRYGPGLRQHLRDLMGRLSERAFFDREGSQRTLLEALVLAALFHANSIPELSYHLFAEALDISDAELHANIIGPLGKEAALSTSLGRVFVRHALIAETICDLAADFGIHLEEATEALVSAAVRLLDWGPFDEGLVKVAYLAKHLKAHPGLRHTAGAAAIRANPRRLSYYTTLSSVQRATDPTAAIATNRAALTIVSTADDPHSLSGFYMEWGISEGLAGNHEENVVLVGASIRDGIFTESTSADPSWISASLTHALTRLWRARGSGVYLLGIKGALDLASSFTWKHHLEWREQAEEILWKNGHSYDYPLQTRETGRLRDLQTAWEAARRASIESIPRETPLGSGFSLINRAAGSRLWRS